MPAIGVGAVSGTRGRARSLFDAHVCNCPYVAVYTSGLSTGSDMWQARHNGWTLITLPVSLAILNDVKVMNSLIFDANKTLFLFFFLLFSLGGSGMEPGSIPCFV